MKGLFHLIFGGLCLLMSWQLAGCQDIQGGGVEVGWELRDYSDVFGDHTVKCEEAGIGSVQLVIKRRSGSGEDLCRKDPCLKENCCRFGCDAIATGFTGFLISEGIYEMSLTLLDEEDEAIAEDRYLSPSVAIREVKTGEVTNLGVNLITLNP